MDDAVAVGVVERLGELEDQGQSVVQRQILVPGGDERVEALGVLVEPVDEGRAVLRLGVGARTVEAGVRDRVR